MLEYFHINDIILLLLLFSIISRFTAVKYVMAAARKVGAAGELISIAKKQ